jgi:peptidyl-prolyl cis-trans isomerase A (cyclophilin A)
MKNLLFLIFLITVVSGIFLVLSSKGPQTSDTTSNKEVKSVRTYSKAPEVLPESERVGKKAKFETSLGDFTVELFGDKTPKTVSNFIFLSKNGFYNGLTFHRIIDGFMIQGGDPEGNGTGGPGYQFEDEFDPSLTFSKVGLLAMANSGPGTNGSQFFITVSTPTYLNNKHTIFGEVVEGMDVVTKISKVKTDSNDKPLEKVEIKKIEII